MQPDSHGLSFGWIFIILLVVGVSTFLIVGSVYKYTVQGARGTEMIPKMDAMRAFAALVRDGFIFTRDLLFGRQSDYMEMPDGAVATAST